MAEPTFFVRQLVDEIEPPVSGRQSTVLAEDARMKVMLFVFAPGAGLPEHTAPFPAVIQIIKGEASLTVGEESVEGRLGTWIQMAKGTPHSIAAKTSVVLLLTLLK